MAKIPSPFKYREKWRCSVTLANKKRRVKEFPLGQYDEAKQWIADQLANANAEHEPELGGPTQANLAQALEHYAGLCTIEKGGAVAELTRISHYLEGAGMKPIKLVTNEDGKIEIMPFTRKKGPDAWQKYTDKRRALRVKTYEHIHALAKKRCSAISKVDIRRLMACMKAEGLSDSTVQKEISLLRHLFNTAINDWNWSGFKNPCAGIVLGKSKRRFVALTTEQRAALKKALEECDNPYYYSMVQLCHQTALRVGSLLQMTWDQVDLEGRIAVVPSKTGQQVVALSVSSVNILKGLPRDDASGRVFPMTYNACDCAWDGVRKKAGLPKLQFRDLRHVSATDFVRRGVNAHQLKNILGHTEISTSQYYVDLVSQDLLDAIDSTEPFAHSVSVPPALEGSAKDEIKRRRTERLAKAMRNKASGADTASEAVAEENVQKELEAPRRHLRLVAVGGA